MSFEYVKEYGWMRHKEYGWMRHKEYGWMSHKATKFRHIVTAHRTALHTQQEAVFLFFGNVNNTQHFAECFDI